MFPLLDWNSVVYRKCVEAKCVWILWFGERKRQKKEEEKEEDQKIKTHDLKSKICSCWTRSHDCCMIQVSRAWHHNIIARFPNNFQISLTILASQHQIKSCSLQITCELGWENQTSITLWGMLTPYVQSCMLAQIYTHHSQEGHEPSKNLSKWNSERSRRTPWITNLTRRLITKWIISARRITWVELINHRIQKIKPTVQPDEKYKPNWWVYEFG